MTNADFLRAVFLDPEDDAIRLIYADWLEERGDERGEFIRVQIQLTKLRQGHPQFQVLKQREAQLLEAHRSEWIPAQVQLGKSLHAVFRKGLLEWIRNCDFTDESLQWLDGNLELRELHLYGDNITDAGMPCLLAIPHLQELWLEHTQVGNEGLRVLAQHPALLALRGTGGLFDDHGLQHLHASTSRLAHIDIYDKPFSAEALARWREHRMQCWRNRSHAEQRKEAIFVLGQHQLFPPARTGNGIAKLTPDRWTPLADLEYLTALPELEILETGSALTNAAMVHIARLSNLRQLRIHASDGLADEGIALLKTLVNLEQLVIYASEVTGSAFIDLVKLPRLWFLGLHQSCGLSDVGMAALLEARQLRRLQIWWAGSISDQGLAVLAHLTQLEVLELRGGGYLNNDQLRYLAGLKNLTILRLTHQEISDAGLHHLSGLTQLEWLDLEGTNVTHEGAQTLLQQLPKVSIVSAENVLLKHGPTNLRFIRRVVDEQASFEVPERWLVREWETSWSDGGEQFRSEVREDGFPDHTTFYSVYFSAVDPGTVRLFRLPRDEPDPVKNYENAAQSQKRQPQRVPGPWEDRQALCWREESSLSIRLDFVWQCGRNWYLMWCIAPVGRFASLEPVFLHMARSFQLGTDWD